MTAGSEKTMSKRVTKRQAEQVLARIQKQFKGWIDPEFPGFGPVLLQDFDGWDWVVMWEEGPFEWTVYAFGGGVEEEFGMTIPSVDEVPGVGHEALNHYSIGLYVQEPYEYPWRASTR